MPHKGIGLTDIVNPIVIIKQREYSTMGETRVWKSKNAIYIASLTGIKNGV